MKISVFKSIVERLYDGFFNKEEEKNYIELEKQQIIDFANGYIQHCTIGDYNGDVQILKPIEEFYKENYG